MLRLLPALGVIAVVAITPVIAHADTSPLTITWGEKQHTAHGPVGTRLELVAQLDEPRMITLGPDQEMLVGSKSGMVYRLMPPYDFPEELVQVAGYPHSAVVRDGYLYVATTEAIYRMPYQRDGRVMADQMERWLLLPAGGGHSSRTLAVGPDKRLYVSLGIAGNCTDQYLDPSYPFEDQRGGVAVIDDSGALPVLKPYASGLRNPVGLAWFQGALYATNNGPDHLGFDEPRELLVKIHGGDFFGMPWYVRRMQNGTETLMRDSCITTEPPKPMDVVPAPYATFDARNAPLGITFVDREGLPGTHAGDAIVALHGSWATKELGDFATRRPPKIVRVATDGTVSDLVTGFQSNLGERWGRPAGVLFAPDGALYFTLDEDSEGLYRLSRETAQP